VTWKPRIALVVLGLLAGVSLSSFVFARHGCNQDAELRRSRDLATIHRDRVNKCKRDLWTLSNPREAPGGGLMMYLLCKLRSGSKWCFEQDKGDK
jgi:hypothetical protein